MLHACTEEEVRLLTQQLRTSTKRSENETQDTVSVCDVIIKKQSYLMTLETSLGVSVMVEMARCCTLDSQNGTSKRESMYCRTRVLGSRSDSAIWLPDALSKNVCASTGLMLQRWNTAAMQHRRSVAFLASRNVDQS